MKKHINFINKTGVLKRLTALFLVFMMLTGLLPSAATAILPASALPADIKGGILMTGNEKSVLFNDGWRFSIGTNAGSEAVSYNDNAWREVELPHDWLIEQFNKLEINDLYKTDIGWYRNTFYLPEEQRGQNVTIRFDGVYMDTIVYVNGQKVGEWAYGYTTFQFDITDFLNFGNTPNVIAVRVNHLNPNTRWYSGAGIYRNVWLTVTDPVHVDYNGTYISTDGADTVTADTEVKNTSDTEKIATVVQTILDAEGQEVATSRGEAITLQPDEMKKDSQTLTVNEAELWDTANPYLYKIRTEIEVEGEVCDTYVTSFGFRTIEIKAQEGFFLNGKYTKLHGVNMHHDLGALGSAVNVRATERQLQIMQDMGVNAIRTSHNPPSPEMLALCDRMGIMVIDEAFDMWNDGKTGNDYHRFFEEWSERDSRSWLRRDRNHPSVIMWSIGNEVVDTKRADGIATAERLISYVNQEDPRKNALRTIGSNYMSDPNAITIGLKLDAAGYNYIEDLYDNHHVNYPNMGLYASESASAVRSRGIYHLPTNKNILRSFDGQCSSYDNAFAEYGDSAEKAWIWDRDRDYVLGEFVWTGFDYIGEPWPFTTKNAYFGIVDTAGLPKDVYYFYQSVWTDKPMVHLLPHWDWNEGEIIPVWAYSNAASVELFKDGVSLGKKTVDLTGSVLHSEWLVPYSPGTLTVKAYDANGDVVATDSISSFGDGAKIKLEPDRTSITADGKDLVFVETSILDEDDVFVANARNRVEFTVSGAGKLVGIDNGDSTDYESYQAPARKAFSGKMVAIIQSDGTEGEITITAKSPGLPDSVVTVRAEHTQSAENITLSSIDDSDAITAERGKLKMQAQVTPPDADYKRVSYSVTETNGSPTDKAVIDRNGVLTAYKNGTVKVMVTALDGSGETAEKTVNISGQNSFTAVSEITVSGATAITVKSATTKMTAAVTPSNAAVKDIRWSVRNKTGIGTPCATINFDGVLRAQYDGVVTVRAEAMDGSAVYGEREVTISNQFSQSVPVRKISLELVAGSQNINGESGSVKVKAVAYPAGASVSGLEWGAMMETGLGTTKIADIKTNTDGTVTVTGKFNGAFNLCASVKNGTPWPQAWGLMPLTITGLTDPTLNPYNIVKAQEYSFASKDFKLEGPSNNLSVGGIQGNDWIGFKNVDFGEDESMKMHFTGGRADSGSAEIEVRAGSATGQLLAAFQFGQVSDSGDWQALATRTYDLKGLTGIQDLYFIFKNGGLLFNSFMFEGRTDGRIIDPYNDVRATEYSLGSKTSFATEGPDSSLGNIKRDDWIAFKSLDFGNKKSLKISLTGGRAISGNEVIEVRDGSPNGTLLTTLLFEQVHETDWFALRTNTYDLEGLTGVHDLYFVFKDGAFVFNKFVFEGEGSPIVEPEYTLGDVNDDGKINIFDIMEIRDHIFGKNPLSENASLAADINDDKKINIFDIMAIRDHIFGKNLIVWH